MKASISRGDSYRSFSTFLTVTFYFKISCQLTEFEQSSITFIWPWHFLHTVNFVISVFKDSMEMCYRNLFLFIYCFLKTLQNNHYRHQIHHDCRKKIRKKITTVTMFLFIIQSFIISIFLKPWLLVIKRTFTSRC